MLLAARRHATLSLALMLMALMLVASAPRSVDAQQTCAVKSGEQCGSEAAGTTCCPTGNYCQSWYPEYYQCISTPSGCGEMETDIDYFGGDIASFTGIQPWDCCAKCQANADCKYFSFVNQGGPACYLKNSNAGRVRALGVISGKKIVAPTPAPPPTCSVQKGEQCGSVAAGTKCCTTGNYCQSWYPEYYQCIANPTGCGDMETDIDYFGSDIASFTGIQPWECCAKCRENPDCKYFSFINQGGPACYLKSSNAGRVRALGVISGKKVTSSTPAPPTPVPAPAPAPTPTPTCAVKTGEQCGSADSGTSCCPSSDYCQPWYAEYYQCINTPSGCGEMETDIDYFGGDIASFTGIQPWDCCAKCRENPDCKYFSFVNQGGPGCYLKNSNAGRVRALGVISGKKLSSATPAPTTSPPAACVTEYEQCGSAGGASCCQGNSYCQPWDPGYYQCIGNSDGCGDMETDIDYYGNDITSISNIYPWDCCAACQEVDECKYYTFINITPNGPTCFLKSSNAGRVRTVGAVSGRRLTTPAPTTRSPTPTPAPTPPSNATLCSRQLKSTFMAAFDIQPELSFETAAECCTACAKTPKCKLFSFFKSPAAGTKPRCLLLSKETQKTSYADKPTFTVITGYVDSPLV